MTVMALQSQSSSSLDDSRKDELEIPDEIVSDRIPVNVTELELDSHHSGQREVLGQCGGGQGGLAELSVDTEDIPGSTAKGDPLLSETHLVGVENPNDEGRRESPEDHPSFSDQLDSSPSIHDQLTCHC